MTEAIWAAMDATWPAAETARLGPWTLRRGLGGGKRVSAANVDGDWALQDIDRAATAMACWGQGALFVLRPGDDALDGALAAQGYRVVDPGMLLAAPVAGLVAAPPAPLSAFVHWPGLRMTADIWAECGTGPARLAVMDRVTVPKAVILGRHGDRAAAVGFVALSGDIAMLHAVEVLVQRRRQGVARNLVRAAAVWAEALGAATLALAVTAGNRPARALYASLGMDAVGQYHYRAK